jgi:hypothetical protein
MIPSLSRSLAVLLLLLALTPLVFIGLRTINVLTEQREAIATAEEQLQRLEAASSIAPSVQDLDSLKVFSGRFLLGRAPPPVLAAALQERLRGLAQERGVAVIQASEIPSQLSPPLIKVGLKLDVEGPEQAVLDLAEEIERLEPWLRIEAVALRSGFIDTSAQQQEPLMTASLEIWGHAVSGETP